MQKFVTLWYFSVTIFKAYHFPHPKRTPRIKKGKKTHLYFHEKEPHQFTHEVILQLSIVCDNSNSLVLLVC